MSLHRMAQNWLGDPLDTIPPWVADPQGRYLGGNDMQVSLLGLARIGQMILNGGELNGNRVVSEGWIPVLAGAGTFALSGDEYGFWLVPDPLRRPVCGLCARLWRAVAGRPARTVGW